MPIPDNQLFEAFLTNTKLVSEKPEAPFVIFGSRTTSASVSEAGRLYLSYPDMEMKLESVLTRITKELLSKGCAADESIALATLGLICETSLGGESSVVHANRCLEQTHMATLHQVTVLPTITHPSYRIARAAYSFEPFDPKQLLYWAERGHSGYPINIRDFSGRLCVKRAPQKVKIIDWDRVPGCSQIVKRWGMEIALASVVDEYYQAIAQNSFAELSSVVKDDLLVLEAGALMYVDIEGLLNSMFADHLGLFTWTGRSGSRSWALMSKRAVLHTNLYPMSLYLESVAWLESELGFRELSDARPLDATIRTYSRFLQRAHQHRLDGRKDEAFLHFVIAMDLLLGLEGRTSENVCQRAGLLVHRQLGKSLETQAKVLRRLYDGRSKYVHEGKPTSVEDLQVVEEICTQILWNLLAVSSRNRFNNVGAWLSQVDYLAAAINASRVVSDGDMEDVGLPNVGRVRNPPNRVQAGAAVEQPQVSRLVPTPATEMKAETRGPRTTH